MELSVLIIYLILCCLLGFFRVPAIKSFKDYALGSIQFSTLPLSLSMVAALVDSGTVVGSVGASCDNGIVYILPKAFIILKWWLFAKCLSIGFDFLKKKNCISLADIMTVFYGRVGTFCATIGLIQYFFLLGAIYKASGDVIETYVGIPIVYGAAIIACAVTLYSIFGGVHAVVTTDIIQFVIFITILPCIVILGIMNFDVANMISNIPNDRLTISTDQYPSFLSQILYVIVPTTGFDTIQRFLMCKDKAQVKGVSRYTGYIYCVFAIMMCTVGLLSSGLGAQGDNAIFFFLNSVVPASLHPLILVSFLAVFMSTASAFLNSISVILIRNVCSPMFKSFENTKKLPIVQAILGIIVSLAAFSTIFTNKKIIEILWMLDSFWDPLISAPLVMGLIGYTVRADQFKYVVITSLVGIFTSMYFIGVGSIITWAVSVLVSLSTIIILRNKTETTSGTKIKYESI